MSEIIKLPGNVWGMSHKYGAWTGPLNKKLQVNGSTTVFTVHARKEGPSHEPYLLVTVTANHDAKFHVQYTLGPYASFPVESGMLSNMKSTSDRHRFGGDWNYMDPVPLKLTFEELDRKAINLNFCSITGDMLSYFNGGRIITLIGADGSATVRERLLRARSEALEAMFEHDSKEKQTGQIELKDFDSKILSAFAHFLEKGEVKDGKDTALGLILLSDKYDIQYMKEAAELFIKKNIKEMDQDEVLDIYHKVNRETLKKLMVDSWSEK